MTDMLTVAACICRRYQEAFGEKIDEMKLHKLMYFTQREALIQNDEPLFPEEFHGWRYGPVLPQLREPFQQDALPQASDADMRELECILDTVFAEYAGMDSFSLSRLTHGEICWRRSRKGIHPSENSDQVIPTEDIRLDARQISERKKMLRQRGLL